MAGEVLHYYDRALCNYIVDNIMPFEADPTHVEWVQSPDIWPELQTYLLDPAARSEGLLFNHDELIDLSIGLNDAPWDWSPYEPLHRGYVDTVPEVRKRLSRGVAETWSRDCDRLSQRLENEQLTVCEGIEIVSEWLVKLRRLLRAMNATKLLPRPEGQQPTPSTRPTGDDTAPASTGPPKPPDEYIRRMREAIRRRTDGRDTSPDRLVKDAKINRKHGRKALRWLESQGEYTGFSRPAARPYRERRPNEPE
jgi:hypothetical protein